MHAHKKILIINMADVPSKKIKTSEQITLVIKKYEFQGM